MLFDSDYSIKVFPRIYYTIIYSIYNNSTIDTLQNLSIRAVPRTANFACVY